MATNVRTDSLSVNQNQGASLYPFADSCPLGGIVSDIFAIFEKNPKGDVYVKITFEGTNPCLVFTNTDDSEILSTIGLSCKDLSVRDHKVWFFSDTRGNNTVRYSEYLLGYCLDNRQSMSKRVKLVSRCWASRKIPVYYAGQKIHSNNLQIELDPYIVADINGQTITLREATDEESATGSPVLRTINGQPGDRNRNFTIGGDNGCIAVSAVNRDFIEREGQFNGYDVIEGRNPTPNTIVIRNGCVACCSCDDYSDQLEEINKLVGKYNLLVADTKETTRKYKEQYSKYEQYVKERLVDTVQIRGTPGKNLVTVTVSVSNPTNKSVTDVDVTLTVTATYQQVSSVENEETGEFEDVTTSVSAIDSSKTAIYVHNKDEAIKPWTFPYTFTITKLRAHDAWSGIVVISLDRPKDKAVTFEADVEADVPWNRNKVECNLTVPALT